MKNTFQRARSERVAIAFQQVLIADRCGAGKAGEALGRLQMRKQIW
jgi:hypothetical protein